MTYFKNPIFILVVGLGYYTPAAATHLRDDECLAVLKATFEGETPGGAALKPGLHKHRAASMDDRAVAGPTAAIHTRGERAQTQASPPQSIGDQAWRKLNKKLEKVSNLKNNDVFSTLESAHDDR